jgi:hypothetical protein
MPGEAGDFCHRPLVSWALTSTVNDIEGLVPESLGGEQVQTPGSSLLCCLPIEGGKEAVEATEKDHLHGRDVTDTHSFPRQLTTNGRTPYDRQKDPHRRVVGGDVCR